LSNDKKRHYADPLKVRPNNERLEIRKHFFTVRAAEQWNSVPASIKRARTVTAFKAAYANHRNKMI
jgi:hypothetical protein